MNNYAEIQNGKVTNTVISENDFAQKQGWVLIPTDLSVGIGWEYDGENFIDNRPKPDLTEYLRIQEQKDAIKASALAKLTELGLTQEEILAITSA
jgi:hypothetical protein